MTKRIFLVLILLLFLFNISGCGPADTETLITATGGGDEVVIDTQPPTTPSGVVATAISPSQINIRWTPSTDDVALAGYIVKRDGETVGAPGSNGFADAGLEPATEYCYSVSAYDKAGNQSAYSGLVCATTLPEVVAGEWKLPFGYIGWTIAAGPNGEVFVGGGYDSAGNPFVGRINADGTVEWIRSIPGTAGTDRGVGIAVSPDGNTVYLKYYFDAFNQSSTGYEEFVAKFGAKDGAIVWTHKLSVPCGTNGWTGGLSTDSSGALYAAGTGCLTKLTDEGASVREEFTENLFSAADVFVQAEGEFYYSTGALPVDGNFVVTLAKYRKSDGGVEWEREWARVLSSEITNAHFGGESLCSTPNGVVFVGTFGYYFTVDDIVHLPADIVRWDEEGNLLGETPYGALPIGAAKGMDCDQSIAYFGVSNAIYAMDGAGSILWSNGAGSGTLSPDGIAVRDNIVYHLMDNVVRRFDAQTGDEILP